MKSTSTPDRTASNAQFNRLAELVDHHAAGVWLMALLFFEDLDAAEEAVAGLFVEAAKAPYPIAKSDFRREVCGRMYLESRQFPARAGTLRNTPLPVADDITRSVAHVLLEALSGNQRTAFALCWLGEHTYRQAAELLSLPDRDVLNALRLGLQALDGFDSMSGAATRPSGPNAT